MSQQSSPLSSPRRVGSYQRRLNHWPEYSEYTVSEETEKKMSELLRDIKSLTEDLHYYPEEMTFLMGRMRKEMEGQETMMNREVVEGERNAFIERFKHKLSMERANYQRNVKELLRCKKEYRLEKQREEIRANGIKRMKKMGEEDKHRWKKTEEAEDLEDII